MDSFKDYLTSTFYVSCFCIIILFYLSWLAIYSFNYEWLLTACIIFLSMIYTCGFIALMLNYPYITSCLLFVSIIIIIIISILSGFKQNDGTQGTYFLSLGITPLICGILLPSSCVPLLLL